MLTEEILKQSTTFKDWITGKISLIHNCYYDSADKSYSAFIVVSDETDYKFSENFQANSKANSFSVDVSRKEFQELTTKINGNWTITRFFEMGGKIQVSVDYSDIPTEKVFSLLLSKYSRGLA